MEQIYEKLAELHSTTAEEVRAEIESALVLACESPAPEARKACSRIPCEGERPSLEEVIAYCALEAIKRTFR
jgi:hypothetical protein